MILAYERIGWLVPQQRQSKKAVDTETTPSRHALERRLRKAEAEAERLRAELDRIG